jgi:hypothetical protein
VVGRLASRYGLTVNFRPSSRGGTGVVVMIPRPLITQPGLAADPGPATLAGGPARPAASSPSGLEPALAGSGASGELPVRPRGATLAAANRSMPPASPAPAAQPGDAAARFAAFRQSGEQSRSDQEQTR